MKISRVEPILVRTPLKLDDVQPHAGGLPKNDIHTVLVRVDTDEGVTGWGEAFSNAGWQSTVTAIAHVYDPAGLPLGRDQNEPLLFESVKLVTYQSPPAEPARENER